MEFVDSVIKLNEVIASKLPMDKEYDECVFHAKEEENGSVLVAIKVKFKDISVDDDLDDPGVETKTTEYLKAFHCRNEVEYMKKVQPFVKWCEKL